MTDGGQKYIGRHNAYAIATVILNKRNDEFTPLQLNKLIYFSHGWLLGLYGEALITENVEAWKYGPVIPSIYYTFREHGKKPIKFNDYFSNVYADLEPHEKDIINQVVNVYGDMTGSEMIGHTHENGTPWKEYYKPGVWNIIIPNTAIKEFFERESQKNDG